MAVNVRISSQMKLEAREIWFYRKMPRIPWTEHGSNKVLRKNRNKKGAYTWHQKETWLEI